MHRSGRVGLVVVLTLVTLIVLSVTAWAWSLPLQRGLAAALTAQLTATPTRTPRPLTPAPTLMPLDLVVVAFTPTPSPAVAITAAPTCAVTPESMPEYLAKIVGQYGMDPARRFIVVDQDRQKMTIWDPGAPLPVRELPVSTADEAQGYRTPAWYGLVGRYWGTFFAYGTYADEGWYLYDDYDGSVLIHSAPYTWVDGKKIYEDLDALGKYPASHGCIRLIPEDAAWLTAWRPQGVPLVILARTNRMATR